jgi:predicted enzyme related to lactoylglutathione lyase
MGPWFLLVLCLAASAPGQTRQGAIASAISISEFRLAVANLEKSYGFYHALGLNLDTGSTLGKPVPLSESERRLANADENAKMRRCFLKIPNVPYRVELIEYSGMELRPAQTRIQEPGAVVVAFDVGDLDPILAKLERAGGQVITTGGIPVSGPGGPSIAIAVRDPDGYYVNLMQSVRLDRRRDGFAIGAFSFVVKSTDGAAAFYGAIGSSERWESSWSILFGTPGAQVRSTVCPPGRQWYWGIFEFKDVDRRALETRVVDPGTAAVVLKVDDIDEMIGVFKAGGGSSVTEGESVRVGTKRFGFVRDPAGVLIEFEQE